MIDALGSGHLTSAVGYALVAFVWQGAAIGAVAAVLLTICRRSSPSSRYAIGCAALLCMALAPVITVVDAAHETAASTSSVADLVATVRSQMLPRTAVDAGVTSVVYVADWLAPYFPILTMLWTGGVLAGALHLVIGWWRLRRMLRWAVVVSPAGWSQSIRARAAQLGVTARVQILTSTLAEVPAVVGWLRPAIVLPASALAGLPASHLDAVVAHELAHLRRRDYLVNALQCALEVLLFYHPAVWWVSHQVRREREHCCDDAAAAACGDVQEYARALVSLEELRSDRARLALAATGGHLLTRVRRLVEPSFTGGPTLSGGLMMAMMLSMLVLVGGMQIGAANPEQAPVTVSTTVTMPEPLPAVAQAPVPPQTVRQQRRASVTQVSAPAQQTPATGGINGRVIDTDGGVIPGVTVVVSSPLMAAARSVVSNARGEFRVNELRPGTYDLSVSIMGFRTARGTITVIEGRNAPVRFRLQVGELSESITVAGTAPTNLASPAQTPEAGVASAAPQLPIRVGGDIRVPVKLKDVKPVYPPDALAAGIQGTVTMEAVLAKDGTVQQVRVLQGVTELDDAALTAVRQWLYRPTMLNGQPVEILMTVRMSFVAR